MFDLNQLTSIFVGDGRYWEITNVLSPYTSEQAIIAARIEIEAKYLVALSKVGVIRQITDDEENFLNGFAQNLDFERIKRVKEIESVTKHDVKAIEKFFAEVLCGSSMEDLVCKVHMFLTSEDVNNLAYRIIYSRAIQIVYVPALTNLLDVLMAKAEEWKDIPILGRTHGQAAIPTVYGKEILNFAVRLNNEIEKLKRIVLKGKLNGAIGNYSSFNIAFPDVDWLKFSSDFVSKWGFEVNFFTTQINPYDDLVESFQVLQRINNIMIGFNQDMWRYISDSWLGQIKKEGEIGSSVMTQKINPIFFENGEGNYIMANAIWDVLIRVLQISRLQRDLVNSTETRNIGLGLAFGLIAIKNTIKGIERVYPNMEQISKDLNENWNILGEAVQTVLRANNVDNAYSLVESFTKNKNVDRVGYVNFIQDLPINREIKQKLMMVTPENYLGKVDELMGIMGIEK